MMPAILFFMLAALFTSSSIFAQSELQDGHHLDAADIEAILNPHNDKILKLPPELSTVLRCAPEADRLTTELREAIERSKVKNSAFEQSSEKAKTIPPVNNQCEDAIEVLRTSYEFETCGGSRDGVSACNPSSNAPDVWFRYTADADELIVIDAIGSNFDTLLSVHTGCPGNAANQIACNDDCGNPDSCVAIEAERDTTYWIRASGFRDEAGRLALNISKEGAISGRIVDEDSATAVTGVQILIYTEEAEFVKAVTADNAGNYRVGSLAAGKYLARTINSSGYIDEIHNNLVCEGVICTPNGAELIEVTGGAETVIDFELQKGGNITGTVTRASDGSAMQGAEVHFHDLSNNHISISFTDPSGEFSAVDGLPSGQYLVFAFNRDGAVDELYNNIPCVRGVCSFSGAFRVAVTEGEVTPQINFSLEDGGRLRGTITSENSGSAAPGVQVSIFDQSGLRISTGSTNTNGEYASFEALPPGTYFARTANSRHLIDELYENTNCPGGLCSIFSGTPIVMDAGSDAVANFALQEGGIISGRVTDSTSSAPVSGILLDLHNSAGRHLSYEFPDFDGNYSSLIGLPSGAYFLKSQNMQGYIDELYNNLPCVAAQCAAAGGTPIQVEQGETLTGIDFNLDRGATVSGRITESSTGLPLSDAAAIAFVLDQPFNTFGVTNGCGEYTTAHGLPESSVVLRTINSNNLIDEVFEDLLCLPFCSFTNATEVPVSPARKTRRVDFSLSRILLQDEFQDNILTWNVRAGEWSESDGILQGSPGKSSKAWIMASRPWDPSGAESCSLCTIETEVQSSGGQGKLVILAWYLNPSNRVELIMNEESDRWRLKQISNGRVVASAKARRQIDANVPYRIKLKFESSAFQLWINDEASLVLPSSVIPQGNAGFQMKSVNGSIARILIY